MTQGEIRGYHDNEQAGQTIACSLAWAIVAWPHRPQ